ncbi:DEAD/DEAH box helicase [Pacificitalea manganoxidans]|uniref:DEAD/DEAH box helicase n=1 Tax=Pacificitalea manganoxidans TaxID=1411902 RepID=A0A291M268_9RHOB|nr:DEAD/DEAH box helicase [Pacificitalea manganoxidans]MAQ46778.1 ATP-dependent helicase [Actibacterium sp.]OWU68809.1 DEAD/DEAH box helicase [Roseovarius sp. 22II1-1F6A]ATI42815.1 DEAD/DEAH box helicase [Pacificitalea manganoxidans]MBF53421.1 ATP-dependent helicase [Actibacterium sp.]MDR6307280.1 ATP-dependent RNA helicase RhlE [Pacificitalea manganoxidans]
MDFDMLGLAPRLLAKLPELGISDPTPIQTQAIPHALNGRDVMGLAQTGTGKTLAFGLPLLDALMKNGSKPAPRTVRGLVLAPTRELAKQIADNLKPFTHGTHLKVGIVVGGAGIHGQIQRLERGTDLLVATPGRLIDLIDRRAVDLSQAQFLVLDEADQMLDLGFIHALRKIAPLLAKKRQTMLFSATMPKQMAELSSAYLNDPVRVEVSPPGKAADKVTQEVHFIEQSNKTGKLIDLLKSHRSELALVFARTKHGSDRLMRQIERAGVDAVAIHGNKSQGQRERAIRDFRDGRIKVLVATDVAARGIDIPGVAFVYNYDLPNVPENYVHRIGRTARAGKEGQAVALCAPEEMGDFRAIEKVMKLSVPVASGQPWEVSGTSPAGRTRRRGGGNGGGGHKGGAPRVGKPANSGAPSGKPQRRRRRAGGGGR